MDQFYQIYNEIKQLQNVEQDSSHQYNSSASHAVKSNKVVQPYMNFNGQSNAMILNDQFTQLKINTPEAARNKTIGKRGESIHNNINQEQD